MHLQSTFIQWNRSCGEQKALFGVEEVQMITMHYVSTSPICQVSKKSMKSYLSYIDFGKLLKEREELINIFAYILYIAA